MLNSVKSFGEIKLEDNNLLSRLVTLMNEFKTPGWTVMYRSTCESN